MKLILEYLAILERAEDVKELSRKTYGFCHAFNSKEPYCKCEEGELCSGAIAEFLGITRQSAWERITKIQAALIEADIIESRLAQGLPASMPRRYFKLKGDTAEEAFSKALQIHREQVNEKLAQLDEIREVEEAAKELNDISFVEEWKKKMNE